MKTGRGFFVGLVAAGLVLALATAAGAQGYIYYPPPAMPNYPYYNPVVGGTSYVQPNTFNPWTGTWSYNTGTTQVYSSAYQPGRGWVAPGSMQPVYQPNPGGGYQTGWVWRDIWGNPHGDVTNTTPNPSGGTDTSRQLYSIRPN